MKTVEHQGSTSSLLPRVSSFLLRLMELQIPMALGALICYVLGFLIPASSSYAVAYHPGTYLYAGGDILFLSVPVIAWMVIRGYSRRRSLEAAIAMITPVAAIILLGQLAGYDYLPWLVIADYPAMSLGMLVYMLYRREHFMTQQVPFCL